MGHDPDVGEEVQDVTVDGLERETSHYNAIRAGRLIHTVLLVVAFRLGEFLLRDSGRCDRFIADLQGRVHRRFRVLYSRELHVRHALDATGLLGAGDEQVVDLPVVEQFGYVHLFGEGGEVGEQDAGRGSDVVHPILAPVPLLLRGVRVHGFVEDTFVEMQNLHLRSSHESGRAQRQLLALRLAELDVSDTDSIPVVIVDQLEPVLPYVNTLKRVTDVVVSGA